MEKRFFFCALLACSFIIISANVYAVDLEYTIYEDFGNMSLKGDGVQKLTEDEIMDIAESYFSEKVPLEYQDELYLSEFHRGSSKYYYIVEWERKIDDISVLGEGFFIWIDHSNGNVLEGGVRLGHPSSEIDTIASLNENQARYIVSKAYDIDSISETRMLIQGKELQWIVESESAVVGIDADTGETLTISVPQDSNIELVETSFNPTQYYLDTYWVYLAIVVGVSIISYVKKDSISKILRQ